MAPKRKLGDLPKACAELKGVLGDNVTAESIEAADKGIRHRAFSALGTVLGSSFPAQLAEYKKLTDDLQRRSFLAAFILDPASGGCSVTNETSRAVINKKGSQEVWITEDELGGPKYLNNKQHAAILAPSLETRPHESPALAAAKIKQYKYHIAIDEKTQIEKSKVSVKADSELTPEQYLEVQADMAKETAPVAWAGSATDVPDRGKRQKKGEHSGAPKPPKPGEEEVEADPVVVARLKAKEGRDKALKECKTAHDKLHRELQEVQTVEKKLELKIPEWGNGPLVFLKEKTKEQNIAVDSLFAIWLSAKGEDTTNTSKEDLEKATAMVTESRINIEADYKQYCKETLSSFAKLR